MEIGTQIGPYRIEALLGRGGMAEVYKAWHVNLHRHEALKALPMAMTFDRSFVERFLHEARMAAGLQHPHIAAIHAVSEAEAAQPYFTMELVESGDLSDLLHQRGHLPLAEVLPILRQVAPALDHAHARGIVHRDVKPANVLLKADGHGGWTIKVVDFGIAHAQEEAGGTRLTRTGMIVGTPEYMSPEQAGSGQPVDYRTDLYSLAVVAYEMLCGRPPFESRADASPMSVIINHVKDPPPAPLQWNPTLPPTVNAALLRALAKDPAHRFGSCTEFVQALSTQKSEPPPPLPPSPSRIAPVLIGAAVLGGLALVGLGLHSGSRSGDNGPPPSPPPILVPPTPASTTPSGMATSAPISRPIPPTPRSNPEPALRALVADWRQAWQSQQLDRFISFYDDWVEVDGKGRSRDSYRAYHANENAKQPSMVVDVSNIEVYPQAEDRALVTFAQHFKGWGHSSDDNWESWGHTRLKLRRVGSDWKITSESYTRSHGGSF